MPKLIDTQTSPLPYFAKEAETQTEPVNFAKPKAGYNLLKLSSSDKNSNLKKPQTRDTAEGSTWFQLVSLVDHSAPDPSSDQGVTTRSKTGF